MPTKLADGLGLRDVPLRSFKGILAIALNLSELTPQVVVPPLYRDREREFRKTIN